MHIINLKTYWCKRFHNTRVAKRGSLLSWWDGAFCMQGVQEECIDGQHCFASCAILFSWEGWRHGFWLGSHFVYCGLLLICRQGIRRKRGQISLQIKSQAPKRTWQEKNFQAAGRKSATQKGRRKCADLRGQVTVGYSAWCRPVESMSTGGSPSRVEK